MFKCGLCSDSFSTRNRRKTHRKQTHGTLICRCKRKFVYEKEMEQHRADMTKNAKLYRCPDCCLSFNSELEKQHHLRAFKHGCPADRIDDQLPRQTKMKKRRQRSSKTGTGEHACDICYKRFAKQGSLTQHRNSLGHLAQNNDARKYYLGNFYDKSVKVDKTDMTASKDIADTTLKMLMTNVREQPGGKIFNPNVVKAGSVPINAKIGKADEFDTNIELNVTPTEIRQRGTFNFSCVTDTDTASMKVKRDFRSEHKTIPEGYAAVKVEKENIPDKLLHDNYIVPCKVKEDLFNKIETAKKDLSLTNVDICSKAHGPALTMTIHPDRKNVIKHDINVDITASVKSDISITKHGWPRPATKRAIDKELIDEVIKSGTHLVPKKDEFWSISNSKAERKLLSSIDAGNGCRKKVYKMMKKYVQTCKSQSRDGLPEISSHILKTQVLWSSEKHANKEYWHENNFEQCLTDTMKDMESTLLQSHLPDYFNPNINILEGKSMSQLRSLSRYFRAERASFLNK